MVGLAVAELRRLAMMKLNGKAALDSVTMMIESDVFEPDWAARAAAVVGLAVAELRGLAKEFILDLPRQQCAHLPAFGECR